MLFGIKVVHIERRFSPYEIVDIFTGEANAEYNIDKYSCSFAKMIEYWRETWYQRTNGMTDIEFPFGFVQVNLIE